MAHDARTQTYVRGGDDELRLHVGFVLRERFVLERQLGEGGMGRVFMAVDRQLEGSDRYVAIKVLGDAFRSHPLAFETLRREATNARRLNHPNIVGVYDFDRDGPHVFMVMEYMRGQTLDVLLRLHPDGMTYREAWRVVRSCGEALDFMHRNRIVHSDFKPANVFATEDGHIKVLDLGIARTVQQTIAISTVRFDASALGALTPQYASCEMFEGAAPDARDDVYALAVVCYELLTGRHPFERLNALEARRDKMVPLRPKGLPARPWRALRHALDFDRAKRTASVTEFLEGFGPRPRRATVLPWAAAVIGLGVGAAALYAYMVRDADAEFLAYTLARPQTADPNATPEQIGEWLSYGSSNLAEATRSAADGDYPRLRYYADSARIALELAATRTGVADERRTAASGLLALSKIYAQAATLVNATDGEEGLRCVCDGLKLNPFEPELRRLYQAHLDTEGAEAVTATCGTIDWRGATRL